MLDHNNARSLLEDIAAGLVSVEDGMSRLGSLPFEDLGYAKLDHHRSLRKGFGEVVYCAGKTPAQLSDIFLHLTNENARVLGTRADREHFEAVRSVVTDSQYDEEARVIWVDRDTDRADHPGVVIVTGGTSDISVAREAAITSTMMGHTPETYFDVGICGLHRVLHYLPKLQSANVIIAVAGMEGALPSVVAGLVKVPVIAVPTSVGYGTGMHGFAALLAMLNSCAPGVSVVNIDNGYGAGHLAAIINDGVVQRK